MIRLDKLLADSGKGTRNEVRSIIKGGRVTVAGAVVKDVAMKVAEDAAITVDGVPLSYDAVEYYMLNKPAGVLTATMDKKQKTVLDLIEDKKRRDLFPVGRLDRDTEGLLLITNDGKLAHDLLAPNKHVSKLYLAEIAGSVDDATIEIFHKGVDIGDEKLAKPAVLSIEGKEYKGRKVSSESNTFCLITITEGRYHEIKRMFEACGAEVVYLKRLAMGPLVLDETLSLGEYRLLTDEEVKSLQER